jgi:integrase
MSRAAKPPKYVKRYANRHKNEVTYFRRPGQPRLRLRGAYLSPEWWRQYAAAMAGEPLPQVEASAPTKAGTIAACIASLKGDAWFTTRLSPKSRKTYGAQLDLLEERWGKQPIAAVKPHLCAGLLGEKARQWGAHNSLLSAMNKLFKHAAKTGLIQPAANPMVGLEKIPQPLGGCACGRGCTGHHIWTAGEIAQFRAHHAIGGAARFALELLDATGGRGQSDVSRLGWDDVEDTGGMIVFRPQKTSRSTNAEAICDPKDYPFLAQCLALAPRNRIPRRFLLTEYGKKMSGVYFGELFRGWVKDASLPAYCTPHGIRHAVGIRVANMPNASQYGVAAVLAITPQTAEVYTRGRSTRELSLRAQRGGR